MSISVNLKNNVDTINNKPIQINPDLSNTSNPILFQFEYDSNKLFENKGKLILSFIFSFKNLTIEIFDSNNNLLNKVINYQNIIYIWNTELNDFYIKLTDEQNNVYEKTIYLKNTLNLKTSDLNYLIFNYDKKINDSILKYRSIKNNYIVINYMKDFKNCCKEISNCDDLIGTIYFYDLAKKSSATSPTLKINYFTWNNFNNYEIIKNKLNKFTIGKDKLKYNSQYQCAFSNYNSNKKRCELILSPIEHYFFVDNLLKLINYINKQYQYDSDIYRFLFKNPYIKANDLIVEINSKN